MEQKARGVERDGEGVAIARVNEHCRCGIGAPVDGIDGHKIAGAEEWNGTTVVAHRVIADGHTQVGAVLCRTYMGIGVCHLIAEDIGCHQTAAGAVVHVLQQINNSHSPLTEASEDKRPAIVIVLQIIGKSLAHVAISQRHTGVDKAVAGVCLHSHLAVVGRVIVELTGQQAVHAHHLAVQQRADAVVASVGIMHGLAAQSVVVALGGDDIEHIHSCIAVGNVPLGSVTVVGFCRNDIAFRRTCDKAKSQPQNGSHLHCMHNLHGIRLITRYSDCVPMRYLAPQIPRPEVTQTVVSPFFNVPHEHSYIASVIHDNGHTCPRWV